MDHLKESGLENRCSSCSTLQGGEQSVFHQARTGSVLKITLERLLKIGTECVQAFLSAAKPSWVETGSLEGKDTSSGVVINNPHNYDYSNSYH